MAQTKIPKILRSSILWRKFSRLPKSPVVESPPSLGSLAHLSSIPNGRPMRGERRRRDDDNDGDDESERSFLRNLNFGGGSRDDDAEKPYQNPPSGLPSRPLRGDRRPMRGEGGHGSHQNLQSFRGGDGDGRIDGSVKVGDGEDRGKGRPSGESLLEKLNIGSDMAGSKMAAAETEEASVPEDADMIFKKMKETGLIPNAVAMLDGLCKDGLIQDAMKLFGLMREKGTIPEVVIYTAVVEGFCKAAKFDDAKRIFRKMQKNGIVPNAFSYGVVIQGLCRGKRLEDAVEFCVEMLEAGHVPNAVTFTGLVHAFCQEKGLQEAEGLVRKLREKGFAMDEKAIRDYLDKKGPSSPMVWEAIFGKKNSNRPF